MGWWGSGGPRHLAEVNKRNKLQETWVKANDPHFDAKCWPALHPHATGSVLSEPRSVHSRLMRAIGLAEFRADFDVRQFGLSGSSTDR